MVTLRRRLIWGCVLVVLVVAARQLAGPWAAAVIVALAATVGLIRCLAALDAWVGGRGASSSPGAVVVSDRSPREAAEHLAFARSLAAVAAAYVVECERGAGLR